MILSLVCTAMLANTLLNVARVRRDWDLARGFVLREPLPLISVCVPARNEASNIAACVASLARQNYPNFEVLVLDDCSDDGTGEVARNAADGHANIHILTGEPLPPGWIGKPHACRQLAQAARGEWLLFTDADTVYAPGALRWALRLALGREADLLSGLPRLPAKTIWERLSVPLLAVSCTAFINFWLTERLPYARYGAASGAFLFFRRAAYDSFGGHEAVRGRIVEDIELARATKRAGYRLVMTDVSRLVSCRMYTNFREVWEGFTKNFYAAFPGGLFLFFIFGLLAIYTLPWLNFLFRPGPVLSLRASMTRPLLQIACVAAMKVMADRRNGSNRWLDACLTPLMGLFMSLIALRSGLRHLLRQPTPWRARHYELWKHDRPH